MKMQGAFSWDIENDKIRFGGGIWIALHEVKFAEETVRRLYVTEDIILPSSHQTEVPVRISHQSSRDRLRPDSEVDDGRGKEDGEGRRGAKSNNSAMVIMESL